MATKKTKRENLQPVTGFDNAEEYADLASKYANAGVRHVRAILSMFDPGAMPEPDGNYVAMTHFRTVLEVSGDITSVVFEAAEEEANLDAMTVYYIASAIAVMMEQGDSPSGTKERLHALVEFFVDTKAASR